MQGQRRAKKQGLEEMPSQKPEDHSSESALIEQEKVDTEPEDRAQGVETPGDQVMGGRKCKKRRSASASFIIDREQNTTKNASAAGMGQSVNPFELVGVRIHSNVNCCCYCK